MTKTATAADVARALGARTDIIRGVAALVRLTPPEALPEKWGSLVPREAVVTQALRIKDAANKILAPGSAREQAHRTRRAAPVPDEGRAGSPGSTCARCGGDGQIADWVATVVCPDCNGTGRAPDDTGGTP